MSTILIAFDGSHESVQSFPMAAALAGNGSDARVRILTLTPSREGPELPLPWLEGPYEEHFQKRLQAANEELERLGVPNVDAELQWNPNTSGGLNDAAAGADLMVMGTHQRGLLATLFGGSLLPKVLDHLTTPCILVPESYERQPAFRHILIANQDGMTAALPEVLRQFADGGEVRTVNADDGDRSAIAGSGNIDLAVVPYRRGHRKHADDLVKTFLYDQGTPVLVIPEAA